MMSDNLTLFDMEALVVPPAEPVIERYVVVIMDAEDGKSFYRRNKRHSDYDSFDDFVELDTDLPIPTKGTKLPTLYKTPNTARQRVSDLYRRHKKQGEGINIWVQRWERKESEAQWSPKEGFK